MSTDRSPGLCKRSAKIRRGPGVHSDSRGGETSWVFLTMGQAGRHERGHHKYSAAARGVGLLMGTAISAGILMSCPVIIRK